MLKSYEYRLYPNKEQTIMLAKHFGCNRFIYNWALAKRIEGLFKQRCAEFKNEDKLNYGVYYTPESVGAPAVM